jgi:acyl-CoA synthetase (AMP-forming)/AMP-acid ligase II
MDSILDALEHNLAQSRSRTSFTFLADGDNPEPALSMFEIRRSALALASVLPRDGAVILLFPQGTDFIKAFFGCLYAGAIAVPVSLPARHRGLTHIQSIVADASIRTGITSRTTLANLQSWFRAEEPFLGVNWLFVEDFSDGGSFATDRPKPSQLAFLQYTSGSTGSPKAVMVTHENIVANSRIIQSCFRNTTESVSVCWLPSFHDMGLIDGILQPVFSGFPCILMSPLHFVQRPARWLQALTKYRATYSGGPNFAYDHCVDRITEDELTGVNLSHLHCLYNGSEPIRLNTMRRFTERFGTIGFDGTKMLTCYGLAEATLAVSTSRLGHAPGSRETLVSCGSTYEDTNKS